MRAIETYIHPGEEWNVGRRYWPGDGSRNATEDHMFYVWKFVDDLRKWSLSAYERLNETFRLIDRYEGMCDYNVEGMARFVRNELPPETKKLLRDQKPIERLLMFVENWHPNAEASRQGGGGWSDEDDDYGDGWETETCGSEATVESQPCPKALGRLYRTGVHC